VPAPKRHPYDQWAPDARALDLVGDKWTLLIVRDLVAGPRRFVELQRVLPGISTEQLRSRLNRMVADGLLTRKRYREVPPRVDYELTERARELAPVIGELARWGSRWVWGAPREGEAIDIGAILRSAPGLLRVPGSLRGVLELTVSGEASRVYALHLRRGRRRRIGAWRSPGVGAGAGPRSRSPRPAPQRRRPPGGRRPRWSGRRAGRGRRPGRLSQTPAPRRQAPGRSARQAAGASSRRPPARSSSGGCSTRRGRCPAGRSVP